MIIKYLCRVIAIFILLLLTACGKGQGGVSDADILAAEHMPIEEAYEKLKDAPSLNMEQHAFAKKLENLKDCSGKFANKTERGDVYSAYVSFYLSKGEIYSTVTYTNYRGEIKDGPVTESKEDGYLFQSDTEGDLFGHDQDFHMFFGKDFLRITWAGTCDYVLDRGDGSSESVEDYRVPFDQTSTYDKIVSFVDESFPGLQHNIAYNEERSELNLYFQAPDNTRKVLESLKPDALEAWQTIVDTMTDLSDSLFAVVKIGRSASCVNIYWVERLKEDGSYSESEYIFWVQNGVVRYDYAVALREQEEFAVGVRD